MQAAKPKHELKTAKSSDNHLWVCHYPTNHFKPYYKKKAYIFCCGEIYYQSHLRRAIAQSAIKSCLRSIILGSPSHQTSLTPHMQAQRPVCTVHKPTHTNTQTFLSQQGHLHTLCIIYQNTPSNSANCEPLRRSVQQKQSGLLNTSIHHTAMQTKMRKVI